VEDGNLGRGIGTGVPVRGGEVVEETMNVGEMGKIGGQGRTRYLTAAGCLRDDCYQSTLCRIIIVVLQKNKSLYSQRSKHACGVPCFGSNILDLRLSPSAVYIIVVTLE
jgi:hypothetical protein